jgi:hypothetical protein
MERMSSFFSLWCVSCDFLLIVRALLIHRRRWVEWVVEVVVNRHQSLLG